jgi:hypothetical protein
MMIDQSRPESMNETAEAIAQLATATASDRSTVATLTTTNDKLASQLEAANALITQLKNEIATLKNKIKLEWQGQRPIRTTNNASYCWSHGYQVAKSHTSATCNMKKSGHQYAASKRNTMGGVQWGKECYGGAAKVIDDKINHFALSLDCTPPLPNVITDETAILDSGCTNIFLSATSPCSDSSTIQSSHTCNLLLTDLPPQARQAHILPGLVHNSLISVGQLCDNGCIITFTRDQVTVTKNKKCVMHGSRDPRSRLWRVNLTQKS